MDLQKDFLTKNTVQHPAHLAQNLIYINNERLHHLLPAEGQQLAGQIGGLGGCVEDLFGGTDHRSWAAAPSHNNRGVTLDDSQEVVEIMSDPTCQLADGFQSL